MERMFYKGDTIRLIRELPDLALPEHAEGAVMRVFGAGENSAPEVEAQFYTASGLVTTTLSADAFELVLSQAGGCTTVFWGLNSAPEELIERAMHAMLDHGFAMRQGLNAMRLDYDRDERLWHRAERFSDATGAKIVTSAPVWDGCVVAFSGSERFQLEFRLRGRWQAFVLLHQRFEAYWEQRRSTAPAMSFLRVIMNLYDALGAQCCAVPVAGNWMIDESWDSLLQEPFYPDLFLLPLSRVPSQLPPLFRVSPLQHDKAIFTALPVKFAPQDEPIERTDRELKLNQLRICKALGEKAYDQMYESSTSASSMYSDAKEAYHDAIHIANELGLSEESDALSKRLEHIKAVFRNQFSR